MMTKLVKLLFVALIALVLVACKSNAQDVASLDADNTQRAEAATSGAATEKSLDDEEKVMAFTQCMRDEGIELVDAGVDAEGNVRRPQLAEGAQVSREQFGEAMDVCGKHLEGLTAGRAREDKSERVDKMIALVACLRDKGYDVDDPTVETLEQWGKDFRVEFDWDDPEAKAAYEECSKK